ncbi:teichoic acid transporter [Sphingomonas sp. DBB INV C78]|uniref:lipopolysaccharide biosynthesis protein n=1 Tax=Sphingomonas sp. DBB INV C78 TaxID=3349434 RepID=UPI0036D3FC44
MTEPAPLRSGSLRAILLNTGWMLGGKGFGAVLSLIYIAIVTRSLGLEGFGQFALALGVGQATATFVTFQSWQIIVRYGMPLLHDHRTDALARLVRFTITLDVAAALAGVALATLGTLLLANHFGWTQSFAWQAIGTSAVLVLSTHWTPVGVLRLHDRFATAAACDSVTAIVRCGGAIAVWLIHPSVIAYLAVWAAAEALTALAYWIAAHKVQPFRWPRAKWHEMLAENPGIGRYSVVTNLSSSLGVGGKELAALIIGLVITPAAAGSFRLAQQLAQGLAKLSQILARAIFPELVRSGTAAGEDEFDALLARTLRLTAIGGGIVFALLLLIGRPVIGLIAGPEFHGAYPVLLALGTAAAVDFAAVGFEPALVAMGRADLSLKLRIISTIILIVLIAILPVYFGVIGAGVGVLIASIISICLLWRALRIHRRRPEPNAGPTESAGVPGP